MQRPDGTFYVGLDGKVPDGARVVSIRLEGDRVEIDAFTDDRGLTHVGSDMPYAKVAKFLRAWRAADYMQALRNQGVARGPAFKAADQDLINLLCRGRMSIVEDRWNAGQVDFLFTEIGRAHV